MLKNTWTIVSSGSLDITTAELRAHARVVGSADDALLDLYALAAKRLIEIDSRLALAPTRLSCLIPAGARCLALPRAPFVSVYELLAIEADDSENEIDVALTEHDGGQPGAVYFLAGVPTNKPLKITYDAGPTVTDPIVKLLVLQLAAHWYEHRESATGDRAPSEIPFSYRHIVRALDPMLDGVR